MTQPCGGNQRVVSQLQDSRSQLKSGFRYYNMTFAFKRCPEGHRVGQRGQRTTAGQLQALGGQKKDKRTQGWPARPEDNSRTASTAPGGQKEDTGLANAARGQQQDKCKHQDDRRTRPRHSAGSLCGQLLFPKSEKIMPA